jgi:hypothetical protein
VAMTVESMFSIKSALATTSGMRTVGFITGAQI